MCVHVSIPPGRRPDVLNESAILLEFAAAELSVPVRRLMTMSWAAGQLWAAGYREWLPRVELCGALACLWVSVTTPDSEPSLTDVLPDGCTDLIWQSGRGAFVAGPDTGPAPAERAPGTILVGARFWPGAGGPALGVPLAELRNQRVDLSDCLPRLASLLPADLSPTTALTKVTGLSAELVTARPPDRLVLQATRLLSAGQASVAELGQVLAVSERQLLRRFDEAVGYGPKTMQRVLRFRQVIDYLTKSPRQVDLASLAARLGYADQAHLTRETTRLAGLPPAALARTFAAAQ
jgi:AraC-like DNA-binding protein